MNTNNIPYDRIPVKLLQAARGVALTVEQGIHDRRDLEFIGYTPAEIGCAIGLGLIVDLNGYLAGAWAALPVSEPELDLPTGAELDEMARRFEALASFGERVI